MCVCCSVEQYLVHFTFIDQGGDYTKAQMVRKSPLITLLEFNRANNIGEFYSVSCRGGKAGDNITDTTC